MSNGDILNASKEELEKFKDDLTVMISNATSANRINRGAILDDPRRNLNDECGYPETTEITPERYRNQYDRNPVAARTVEVFPKECWKIQPAVYEDEDPKVVTEFEEAFGMLSRMLMGQSWFQDDEGNPVWEHIIRADIGSGVGSFGVLLLGTDDGAELREPVQPADDRKLTYLRSFDESLVNITRYEDNKNNRRYGMPTTYSVTLNDPNSSYKGGEGYDTATVDVHWTRVIHIADNLGSSEIFGPPRMLPVYNRLLDLEKLYGGSAEMYYKGAFPGYLFSSDPALKGDVNWNLTTIRNQIEQYFNGLQRYSAMKGMTATSLAPQVVDPTPQINTQIEAICIRLGIPKRIFMGSERGNLASTQDENAWNDRLKYRQSNYVTPRIIVPFVDRLIWMGILPEPKGYSVFWPDLATMTGAEKADVAVKRTKAMADYVTGDVETIMSPVDFYSRIIGFQEEEAVVITQTAAEGAEHRMTDVEGDETQPQKKEDEGVLENVVVPIEEVEPVEAFKQLRANLDRVGMNKPALVEKQVEREPELVEVVVTEDEPTGDPIRALRIDNTITHEVERESVLVEAAVAEDKPARDPVKALCIDNIVTHEVEKEPESAKAVVAEDKPAEDPIRALRIDNTITHDVEIEPQLVEATVAEDEPARDPIKALCIDNITTHEVGEGPEPIEATVTEDKPTEAKPAGDPIKALRIDNVITHEVEGEE